MFITSKNQTYSTSAEKPVPKKPPPKQKSKLTTRQKPTGVSALVWSLRNSFGQMLQDFCDSYLQLHKSHFLPNLQEIFKLLRTTTPPLPIHQTPQAAPLSLLLCLWQEHLLRVLCHLSQDLCPCLLEVEDFGLPGQGGCTVVVVGSQALKQNMLKIIRDFKILTPNLDLWMDYDSAKLYVVLLFSRDPSRIL